MVFVQHLFDDATWLAVIAFVLGIAFMAYVGIKSDFGKDEDFY